MVLGALMASGFMLSLGGCASKHFSPEQEKMLADASKKTEEERAFENQLASTTEQIKAKLEWIERIERAPVKDMSGDSSQANYADGNGREEKMGAMDEYAPSKYGMVQAKESDALDLLLTVNWKNASAEDLIRKIAKETGVVFKVSGTWKTLTPITLKAESKTARQILEMLSEKIDQDADVVFNKNAVPQVLELRFKQ